MNAISYITLIICTIVPIVLVSLIYVLIKKWNWFKKRNYWIQQLLIGLLFSILACSTFYFGVEYKTTDTIGYLQKVNGNFGVVNAIPMITGLVFGGPSGFLVGFIAAIFRIFMYPFNGADILRWAECFSVLFSGGLAWILKISLFDNKKPKWFYGIVIGCFIEVIHMLIIYVVAMVQNGSVYAYGIISKADITCFITVSSTITLTLLVIEILEKRKIIPKPSTDKRISTKIQRWFAVTFIVSIALTFTVTTLGNQIKNRNDVITDLDNHNSDVCQQIDENPSIVNLALVDGKVDSEAAKKAASYETVRFHRVNKEGFCILLDGRTQQILSVPSDMGDTPEITDSFIGVTFKTTPASGGEKRLITEFKENESYEVVVYDADDTSVKLNYYLRYVHHNEKDNQNFYVISLLSVVESNLTMRTTIRLTEYLELLIFIIIFAIIYIFIKKVVIKNIYEINNSLDQITNGNLNVKVEVRSNQEFSDLSDDINQTVDTLKRFISEANKRIDSELEYAKKIQQNSLPIIFPSTSKYDLYASMYTAKQVGGDFYDFFPVDDNHLLILIADVSGKGIPAAMFMMRAKTLIKSLIESKKLTLVHIIKNVNNELNEDNKAGMFVTCWCGILNINNGELEFVNCGHNAPLVRKNNKYSYLTMEKNCVLGVIPGFEYKLEKLKLKSNDAIFLYTDGVTEATNKNKELYGEDKLLSTINKIPYKSSSQILNDIYKDVDKFQKGVEQADDITMLMLRYKPSKNNR